jgi:short subunit dehydrogenase-like uncharacterized protein
MGYGRRVSGSDREFDIVAYGATGSTGRLVAEHLMTARRGSPLRLAIAGRDPDKLARIAAELDPERPPAVIVADAHDRPALDALAHRTRVVVTTVGPYAKYGSDLVAACAGAGTHYADLAGELPWVRRMIDVHHDEATRTGARIVCCCGFDSVPSDLGVAMVQREMVARTGAPADDVVALFGETRGQLGGGTAASGIGLLEDAANDPAVRDLLRDPYALVPERPRDETDGERDARGIGYESRLGLFTAPFVMAVINTRVVRRTNAILGYPYGRDFRYREVMSLPRSPRGAVLAAAVSAGMAGVALAGRSKRLRSLMARRMPKPGEGPSDDVMARGHFTVRLIGSRRGGPEQLLAVVHDDRDPGHGSTSRMIGESALCLAFDRLDSPGGMLTPAAAMGMNLVERLRAIGMQWTVDDLPAR